MIREAQEMRRGVGGTACGVGAWRAGGCSEDTQINKSLAPTVAFNARGRGVPRQSSSASALACRR